MTKNILVLSGKGGVGKSTIAAAIASALAVDTKTGLLDADVTNPSQRLLTGTINQKLQVVNDKVKPVQKSNLKIVSTSHLLPTNDTPIMWYGEQIYQLIKEYLRKVDWGELDYLVIDAPAGTRRDDVLAVHKILGQIDGSIIVTTPQELTLSSVRKVVAICRKLKTPIIGIIENMSGLKCPKCKKIIKLFPRTSVKRICTKLKIPYLGRIFFNPTIAEEADKGKVDTLSATEAIKTTVEKIKQLAVKPEKKKEE